MQEEINKAVEVLRRGGIILYPTDTVWGIGCDATNPEAVERIYRLKKSENKKGMIILLDKADNVARYFNRTPAVAWDLMELADKPLTLVLPNAVGVADNLIPEEKTLAVRVPDHEFCRLLIGKLGRPLVSTSANLSGEDTPEGFDDIDPAVKSGVDHVVNRKYEGRPTRKASSIISLGEGGEIKIIRE
jgi:L-threonylcarbamoyladenylate synthase